MAKRSAAKAAKPTRTSPPNLEERVIALNPGVAGVFTALVKMFGRKGAAEKCGLTVEQMDALSKRAEGIRRAPYDVYIRACAELGMDPEDMPASVRYRRPTAAEIAQHYTPLTPEIRTKVRRFVRGRNAEQAAEELDVTLRGLFNLLHSPQIAHIPNTVLQLIEDATSRQKSAFGADEHLKFRYSGYRRTGTEERQTIHLFLMGGTSEDTIALFGAFGHIYSQHHIHHWSAKNSAIAYVNDFDYALMAAIVRIRTIAGYYEFVSDSHDYRTRPLHIKNTAERADTVLEYVLSFGKDGHKPAAKALGTSVKHLRSITDGNLSYIPAWVYVRALEQARTLPNDSELDIQPYIGHSSDLEGKLRDYSLESLKTSFAQPLADIMRYLAEPFKSAFTFLQYVSDHPLNWLQRISALQAYTKVLANNEALLDVAGLWKPTPHQAFVQYLGLNNKSAT